jgi:ABC transporter substrate binding protein
MDRRAFLVMIGGSVLIAPLAAEAQQPGKTVRIGFLAQGAADLNPLTQPLRALGWVEGQNLVFESRFEEGKRDRLPAPELVDRNVDVLFTRGTPAARAAKGATTSIPVVMVFVADPVRSGLVSSLARPGGNITGIAILGPDITRKQFELLKEIAPRTSTVGVLFDSLNPAQIEQLRHEIPAAAADAMVLLLSRRSESTASRRRTSGEVAALPMRYERTRLAATYPSWLERFSANQVSTILESPARSCPD